MIMRIPLALCLLLSPSLWAEDPPIEVNPNEKSNPYQVALSNLDSDGPQYLSSNTLDEVSHAAFLNAYLEFQLHRVRNFAGKHSQRING